MPLTLTRKVLAALAISTFVLAGTACGDDDSTSSDDAADDSTPEVTDVTNSDDAEEGDLTDAMCGEWEAFTTTTGDILSVQTILDNAETIGLDAETVEALLVLADPNTGQDEHEGALAVADEGMAEICP